MSASSAPAELPVPDFYDPRHASAWGYRPDQQALFERATAWRAEHGLPAAAADRRQIHLLLIDVQKDFCFPEGALYVGGRSGRGALEDNDRTARFIYRNLGVISRLTCTLDTHYPYQIFSPEFWLDEQEQPPGPHREVSAAEVQAGKLRPNPAVADWVAHGDYDWLRKQVEYYCQELERRGKYRLYLWPPHCILGSEGHTLVGVVHEARMFHAYARRAPASIQVKGDTPLTEYYSALGPEVTTTFDGQPLAPPNGAFLETLTAAAALIIAGQAASHCVKSTIEDLLDHVDPGQARKVYLLRDCMSSVAVPDPARPGAFLFDFTPQAEEALARFAAAGMHVVESTRPIHTWPGLEP